VRSGGGPGRSASPQEFYAPFWEALDLDACCAGMPYFRGADEWELLRPPTRVCVCVCVCGCARACALHSTSFMMTWFLKNIQLDSMLASCALNKAADRLSSQFAGYLIRYHPVIWIGRRCILEKD